MAAMQSAEGRTSIWVAVLVIASLGLSRAFACATPFAALATLGALTLTRREASLLIAATWAGNQLIGFGLLHYPWTASAVGWGLAIGMAAVAGLTAAGAVAKYSPGGPIVTWLGAFLFAFMSYEAVLMAVTIILPSGNDAYAPLVMVRILAINGAALGLLIAARQLAKNAGLILTAGVASRS